MDNQKIRQLQAQNLRLSNIILAMISNVEQMTIGVGLPNMFLVWKNGETFHQPPDRAESFYRAIEDKWKRDLKPLIRMRENEIQSGINRGIERFEHYIDEKNKRIWELQQELGFIKTPIFQLNKKISADHKVQLVDNMYYIYTENTQQRTIDAYNHSGKLQLSVVAYDTNTQKIMKNKYNTLDKLKCYNYDPSTNKFSEKE